jgi:hypothetical protein
MVSREQAIELYRLILDREPESDAVVNEKRTAESAANVAVEMFTSDEFFTNNKDLLKVYLHAAPPEFQTKP